MTMMYIVMFFLFATQVFDVFGSITIIREMSNPSERKLTCLSEDDGSALVWNDVITKESFVRSNEMRFYNMGQIKPDKNKIDCKMKEGDECIKSWITEKWSISDSLITPFGPVFDERWEEGCSKFSEFKEDGIFDNDMYLAHLKNTTTFSISMRNKINAMIIAFCNKFNVFEQSFCYMIVIGGGNNTVSLIRKCPLRLYRNYEIMDAECNKIRGYFKHSPLSSTEWRTFLVMWDSETRNISVYDADNNLFFLKYQDEEKINTYYTFIQSNSTFVRFHKYTFLHTIVENATLTSPSFQVTNRTICIQLLIGLCVECDINIILFDDTRNEELKKVTVKSSSKAAAHGLPTWQFVTIEHLTNHNSAIMELRPILNSNSPNPLWAVANVRQCPRKGSYRKSVIHATMQNTTSVWPNVTCQKLFYDEYTVVSALSDTKLNVKLNTPECPEGRIGPRCLEVCKRNNDGNNDCNGTAICYKDGCTCSPGFMGPDCFEPCKKNTYGYDCKKTCGACMPTEQSTSLCNTITGTCSYGCNNNPEKFYIPPLCQEVIDKPSAPTIRFINTTNIEIEAPITWKDEYEESLFYAFIIKETTGVDVIEQNWKPIFRNMTKLELFLQNLKPGTVYHIAYELRFCSQYNGLCKNIQSEWQSGEIQCISFEDFILRIKNRSLSIDIPHSNLSYLCPATWYKLMIENVDTNEQILTTLIDKFPYEVSLLLSYTTITVTILHEDKKIFTKEIRTFKEVPSKILNLRTAFVSNTSVTLTWMVPKSIEEIRWYNVTLQIKEYRGCKNAKFTFDNLSAIHLTNETTITIGNLHPHALYSAQVVVHNSRYASAPVKMIFATKQSDIITEIFSHINMQNWNMSWQPPEDCRTIMGPLYARIYIRGISDTLKNFYAVEETANNHLSLKEIKLCYAEIYVATLYAVRHPQGLENPFANKEYVFETPPGVPPRVTNLEIYEIDNSQTPNIVHLRWQGPLLPHNGILRIYQVRSCDATKCTNTEIQLNAICDLWDDYICASIEAYENNQTIDVVAYNVNVSEAGIPFEVSMANHNAIPDEPGNFTVTIHKYSVVDLQWRHPWKTGNCLEYFHIRIYLISTNLVEENGVLENHDSPNDIKVWVINYSRNYTKQLNLLPSTQYLASIQAVTYSDRKSKVVYKLFETPSTLTFSGQLKYKLYETPPSISVHIPSVLHNTKNSTIHIVVKGPQDFKICDGYSKVPKNLQAQIGVNMNDVAWIAAAFPTDKIAGKSFVVGDGEFYGNANNCPLEFKLLYEITVIVTERNKNLFKKPIMLKISISIDKIASAHYEKWLVPVVIIVGIATAFYFYRRCRSCCNSEFNFGKRKRMVIRQRVNRRRMPTNEIPMSEQTVYEEIQVIG